MNIEDRFMSHIVVLIPCYNEKQTIEKVISDYKVVLPEADIYVYDNNSSDGSNELAEKAGAIVRHEYRQGKGNVIRSMFRDIEADCYLMVDGDDTYPAEYARKMCDLVLQGKADMVIGDRLSSTYFEENKRPFHNFGNDLVRKAINTLWRPKKKIVDVMTGYRAFSPLFVKSFPILSQGFEIETEMTIHALDKNLLLTSIPVKYRDRPEGSVSKLNTYSDGMKVLLTIFNLYRDYQPLRFFGIVAAVMALISLSLFVPIFLQYLTTGLVPRIPTLVVSVVMMLAAFLSIVCGLILDTNSKNSRKNFEIQMNIIRMMLKHD
jgi:glycosyltransferase involved in cell wall biosynthesis